MNIPPRIERRTALKWISSATAALPFADTDLIAAATAGEARGYGADPDLLKHYQPGELWPLTFSEDQRQLVAVLADIIMPEDDNSPSASSLGVHDFVDEWISSPYPGQQSDRKLVLKGLDWIDTRARELGDKNFVSMDPEPQLDVCRELAIQAGKDRRKFPGSFFRKLRDLVAGGYYTTPEGMHDIGYRGNVAMTEWNGPPAEVLEKLGLDPE